MEYDILKQVRKMLYKFKYLIVSVENNSKDHIQ